MSEKGVHDGHRKRMRASFLKRDFNSIPEHEILEILLFYSHPRNDTNGLAHRLIKTFGNLENVLSAPYEELIKVDGIGENAATLIILFSRLSLRYADAIRREDSDECEKDIDDYLITYFAHQQKEQVIAVLYNKKGRLMNTAVIGSGGIEDATFSPRELVETAMRCNSYKVIIAHNHPQGFAVPSLKDKETTIKLKEILSCVDIKLLDHIIVGDNETFSMKNSKKYSDIF